MRIFPGVEVAPEHMETVPQEITLGEMADRLELIKNRGRLAREISLSQYDCNVIAMAASFLREIPATKLVPVVTCGECRFRCCNNKCILDDPPRRDFDDDDFCSQGERREGEEEPLKAARSRGE